jgi:CDGSH-type Zn-finger protein
LPREGKERKIKIVKDGPYVVSGNVPLEEKIISLEGGNYEYRQGRKYPEAERYTLCRCGRSKTPPCCDGSHVKEGFDGTETASRDSYAERATLQEGPHLSLMDDGRCASARFCFREKGDAWDLTDRSDDPELREEAIKAACDCPAGRLVALDENGRAIEPVFEPSIEILQDPEKGVSGPLYVKGHIPVESADGGTYEVRNRITLCRCGESANKPFCDAAHIRARYRDEE